MIALELLSFENAAALNKQEESGQAELMPAPVPLTIAALATEMTEVVQDCFLRCDRQDDQGFAALVAQHLFAGIT